MKKLPKINVSFEDMYEILIAPIRSKLPLTGTELKVFNQLSEPRSARVVADAINSHPENTRQSPDRLVAKKNALYQSTPAALLLWMRRSKV